MLYNRLKDISSFYNINIFFRLNLPTTESANFSLLARHTAESSSIPQECQNCMWKSLWSTRWDIIRTDDFSKFSPFCWEKRSFKLVRRSKRCVPKELADVWPLVQMSSRTDKLSNVVGYPLTFPVHSPAPFLFYLKIGDFTWPGEGNPPETGPPSLFICFTPRHNEVICSGFLRFFQWAKTIKRQKANLLLPPWKWRKRSSSGFPVSPTQALPLKSCRFVYVNAAVRPR